MLAVCVLLLTGSAGCGPGGSQENANNANNARNGDSSAPVGKLLDETDKQGHRYREVDEKGAPGIGIEVQPDGNDGGWNVRLTLRDFRLSALGRKPAAVAGRGVARLFVDGRPVVRLRTAEYRLAARYVPHGTHHLTARLYADDGTVWTVDGEPVESTADITASDPAPTGTANGALSAPGVLLRTGGRGSAGPGGEAS